MRCVLSAWALALFLIAFLGGVPSGLASTEASGVPRLLEVTGMLEGVASEGEREVVTLNVYGKLASGPLSSDCRFLDERGQPMDKPSFLQRYMKRVVTVDLEADSGEVVSCRVGS